ncbi:MAG TPA: hypothetical protein DEQ09_09590 [Bacteroidales bacterium]|nr:hypothetical protein [Bacteroidales bacterium]
MERKNHNPGWSIGIFLIVLGLFLAGVFMDVLNLDNPREYFVWPMLLIFIGVLSFFHSNPAFGIITIAVGGYFLFPRIDFELPAVYEKLYWPSTIILAGLAMIISGIVRRYRKN